MKKAITIIAAATILTGCGDQVDQVMTGFLNNEKVEFTLDPAKGPTCVDTSRTSRYSNGGLNSISCIWHCAEYEGEKRIYVSITFENSPYTGGVWVKDRVYKSDGIC